MNISVFSKANCPACDTAKKLLESNNLPYAVIDIGTPSGMEYLREVYPEARTVPQIFVNDERLDGLQGLKQYLEKLNGK